MLTDDIALTLLPEIGPKTAIYLMECFGTAEALFAAPQAEIEERTRLKPAIVGRIVRRESHPEAEEELRFARQHNIRVIPATAPEYPQRLRECPDYPHVLYVMGGIDLNSAHWLSVVGTRNITPYGVRMCETLIGELADLFPDTVIVSGLAYGVDIAAHRSAMQAGLATVGVVAHPLNRIYPPRHTESAREMVRRGGAVASEFNRGAKPDKSGFVQRNRIIAGLSAGTLIVESAAKGGSLITAEMADGYHRTVMAVPGRAGDCYSEGTNNLIKSLRGQMVCSGADIAELLGWEAQAGTRQRAEQHPGFDLPDIPGSLPAVREAGTEESAATLSGPGPAAEALLGLIGSDTPVSLDELGIRSGMPVGALAALLLELELSGRIRALPGKHYILT